MPAFLPIVLALAAAQDVSASLAVPEPPLEASKLKWTRLPRSEDFAQVFPITAMHRDIEGRATIICVIERDGGLAGCNVESEQPPGQGFGAAAISIATKFKAKVLQPDETTIVGKALKLPIRFNLPGHGH